MRRFVTFGVVTFLCMTMGGVVLAEQPRQSPMKPGMMQMGCMMQMGGMMGQMAEMMRSGQMTPERREQMAKMLEDMSGMMGMMDRGMMGQGMMKQGMMKQGMMKQEKMKQRPQMMEQMAQMQKQMMEMMGESSKK